MFKEMKMNPFKGKKIRRSPFDELPEDPPRSKPERPTLKDWQRDDAKRLEALWLANGKPAYSSQDVFGRKFEIGSAQMVWQYVKGVRPLNLGVVVKFAKGLNCNVYDISPTLGDELTQMAASVMQKEIKKKENTLFQEIFDRMSPMQRQSWLVYGKYLLDHPDGEVPDVAITHTPIGSDVSYTWSAQIDPSASAFTPPKTSDQ